MKAIIQHEAEFLIFIFLCLCYLNLDKIDCELTTYSSRPQIAAKKKLRSERLQLISYIKSKQA